LKKTNHTFIILAVILSINANAQIAELKPEILHYKPFIWQSEIPEDCPFEQSKEFSAIKFLCIKSGYHYGDTWEECPHTPDKPIFGESGRNGYPVKIGSPPLFI